MANKNIAKIVETILEDWEGVGYIKSPGVLARFIEEKFKPLKADETIADIAKLILEDLSGPGHYKDPKRLAEVLEEKLELR